MTKLTIQIGLSLLDFEQLLVDNGSIVHWGWVFGKKRTSGLKWPQLEYKKIYCDGPKKKGQNWAKLGYLSKKSDLGPKCSLPKNMDFRPNLAVIGILGQILAFLAHLI